LNQFENQEQDLKLKKIEQDKTKMNEIKIKKTLLSALSWLLRPFPFQLANPSTLASFFITSLKLH